MQAELWQRKKDTKTAVILTTAAWWWMSPPISALTAAATLAEKTNSLFSTVTSTWLRILAAVMSSSLPLTHMPENHNYLPIRQTCIASLDVLSAQRPVLQPSLPFRRHHRKPYPPYTRPRISPIFFSQARLRPTRVVVLGFFSHRLFFFFARFICSLYIPNHIMTVGCFMVRREDLS